MPRPPRDYRDVHKAADSFEPRLARAFLRAMDRARSRVSINDLALAIQAKDRKRAEATVKAALADVLEPAGAIVADAVLRGGRLGAEQVNRERA